MRTTLVTWPCWLSCLFSVCSSLAPEAIYCRHMSRRATTHMIVAPIEPREGTDRH